MEQRILGNTLQVSKLGYGAMGLSGSYGSANAHESLQVLQQAYDLGINFFDTSDMYGNGHNETLVGNAFASAAMREQVIIATKGGIVLDNNHPDGRYISNKPEYIKKACDASLKRLNMDYVDLYYLHRIDPEVEIEESMAVLVELIQAGKIRNIGLSEASVDTIQRAYKVHPITAVQNEYSLWTRDVETNGILKVCNELNIGLVAYSPLGRGFLSGNITKHHVYTESDVRSTHPRFQADNIEANLILIAQLKKLALAKGVTAAQLALAWVMAQGDHIVPIPGTKNSKRLQENVAAAAVELTMSELAVLNELFAPENIQGTRYPEALLRSVLH